MCLAQLIADLNVAPWSIDELVARTELVHFDPAVPLLKKERAKTLNSLWVLAACTASDPLAAYEAFIAPQRKAKLELPEHAFKDFCAEFDVWRRIRRIPVSPGLARRCSCTISAKRRGCTIFISRSLAPRPLRGMTKRWLRYSLLPPAASSRRSKPGQIQGSPSSSKCSPRTLTFCSSFRANVPPPRWQGSATSPTQRTICWSLRLCSTWRGRRDCPQVPAPSWSTGPPGRR